MERKQFIFYRSFFDKVKDLPENRQGRMYKILIEYSLNGTPPPTLNNTEMICFKSLKETIDKDILRFTNGLKGGAPKGNKNAQKQPKNNLDSTENQPKFNQETTEINHPLDNINFNINNFNNQNLNSNLDRQSVRSEKSLFFLDVLIKRVDSLVDYLEPIVIDKLKNIFEQISYQKEFHVNGLTIKSEQLLEKLQGLFTMTQDESAVLINEIFELVNKSDNIVNKFKYIIGVMYNKACGI